MFCNCDIHVLLQAWIPVGLRRIRSNRNTCCICFPNCVLYYFYGTALLKDNRVLCCGYLLFTVTLYNFLVVYRIAGLYGPKGLTPVYNVMPQKNSESCNS